jgi:hypothetical protein
MSWSIHPKVECGMRKEYGSSLASHLQQTWSRTLPPWYPFGEVAERGSSDMNDWFVMVP